MPLKRASARRVNTWYYHTLFILGQIKKTNLRIPVTAKLMAQLIEAAGADRVITCDLHSNHSSIFSSY